MSGTAVAAGRIDRPVVERELRIGPRTMPSRFGLAPLAGYTQLALRRAIREIGGLGLGMTDLVQSGMLLGGSAKSLKLIETTGDDRPLSVQIFGGVRREVVDAARLLADRGYEGIDLNMGCPMAKVTGSGGGARLMCDRDNACGLVSEVVEAVDLPVTVKMRLGWDRQTPTAAGLTDAFADIGVAAVTIHGRTRSQGFGGTVCHDGIAEVVASAAGRIPVIGNGDVRSPADALAMIERTGCDGVAIGRGAMLDPWIFRKLADLAAGETPREPSQDERRRFLVRHFELMTGQHGDYGCVLFRKFAAWYGAVLGLPSDIEDRLRRIERADDFRTVIADLQGRECRPNVRAATALIRVPNGPIEHW